MIYDFDFWTDNTISLKAKAIYGTVVALFNKDGFTKAQIQSVTKEGDYAIKEALDELVKKGYCVRNQGNKDGRFFCNYKLKVGEF